MGKVYIQGEIAIQNNKKSQVPHVRALGKVVERALRGYVVSGH